MAFGEDLLTFTGHGEAELVGTWVQQGTGTDAVGRRTRPTQVWSTVHSGSSFPSRDHALIGPWSSPDTWAIAAQEVLRIPGYARSVMVLRRPGTESFEHRSPEEPQVV